MLHRALSELSESVTISIPNNYSSLGEAVGESKELQDRLPPQNFSHQREERLTRRQMATGRRGSTPGPLG